MGLDKGIFYLVCTAVILVTIITSVAALSKQISRLPIQVVYKDVVVTPTVSVTPTASPSATPVVSKGTFFVPSKSVTK